MLSDRIEKVLEFYGTSRANMAESLGVDARSFQRYLKERRDDWLWQHLPAFLREFPRLSRQWLYFGEGPMNIGLGDSPLDQPVPLDSLRHAVKAMAQDAPEGKERDVLRMVAGLPDTERGLFPQVPMVGLASCGMQGLEQIMPYAVTVSPVRLSDKAVAVVASGESMVPAGIGSGHICYCDPGLAPAEGEAVFLRTRDDKGALKIYLGESKNGDYKRFKGWLPAESARERHEFIMEIIAEEVESIAPVILIRRRL